MNITLIWGDWMIKNKVHYAHHNWDQHKPNNSIRYNEPSIAVVADEIPWHNCRLYERNTLLYFRDNTFCLADLISLGLKRFYLWDRGREQHNIWPSVPLASFRDALHSWKKVAVLSVCICSTQTCRSAVVGVCISSAEYQLTAVHGSFVVTV